VERPFFRFPFVFMALVFFSLWIFAEFGGIRRIGGFGWRNSAFGGFLRVLVEFGGILWVCGFSRDFRGLRISRVFASFACFA
jgi:hypothetical protein